MDLLYEAAGEFRAAIFDATLTELHTGSANATEHLVERGVNISDHVRPERDRLSVEAHVSNTPVFSVGVDGAQGSVQPLLVTGGPFRRQIKGAQQKNPAEYEEVSVDVSANVLQFNASFDRIQAVHEVLRTLMREGTEMTVISALRQYDHMILVNLSAPRNAAAGEGITFSMELQEVRYAESEVVNAPVPLETRGESTRNRGAANAEEPPAENNQQRSIAAALLEDHTNIGLIHETRRNGQGIFSRLF